MVWTVVLSLALCAATEVRASDWSADVLTGKLDRKKLREVFCQFQVAAKAPVRLRITELEKCYSQCHANYPNADEIEVIYACELIAALRADAAKVHLDREIQGHLAHYWPARRLAIYLHSTTEKDLLVANMLKVFSQDLAAHEKRAEVLALNVKWLGMVMEGLRHGTSSDSADIQQVIKDIEATLQTQEDSLVEGVREAEDFANKLEAEKKQSVAKINAKSTVIGKDVKLTEEQLRNQQERLKTAQKTLDDATPIFNRAAAPHLASMQRLEPKIQDAFKKLETARSEYDKDVENEKNKDNDRKTQRDFESQARINAKIEAAAQKASAAEHALNKLQAEYAEAQGMYVGLVTEFDTKYAQEIKITGTVPIALRDKDIELKKMRKSQKLLEHRMQATMALQAKDFLRPNVKLILAEIDKSLEKD